MKQREKEEDGKKDDRKTKNTKIEIDNNTFMPSTQLGLFSACAKLDGLLFRCH